MRHENLLIHVGSRLSRAWLVSNTVGRYQNEYLFRVVIQYLGFYLILLGDRSAIFDSG